MSEANKAVFLSYASQDAEAAKRIADALRGAGVEVWFDAEGGLEHGDEWDAKIRRQIKECVLFLPIISANTQAREEGYFRIEWELAAQRALGIASGIAFILPIVIDDTREPDALVPDRFRSVQWTRLRGGELTPEVKARFLKLWSHRTGALKHEAVSRRQMTEDGGQVVSAKIPSPGWKIYAGLAVAVFALAGGAVWWMGREKAAAPVTAAAAPSVAPIPASGMSEARQLVGKAYVLLRGLDATREDFALAEEYCQRALKLDPDDGEVWAAYAQVNGAFGYRGWDTSPARKEQTRVMAERAIRLAPNSTEARVAQAGAWSAFGINRDEREKLLRDILRDEPDNQGVLRFLAVTVLAKPNGLEECLALNERSAALPGGDPLALFNNARYLWNNGQPAKGYEVLQRALAQKTFTSGLVLKMAMEVTWRGDLAAAEATLRQIPQSALQEDRANYNAGLLRYYQRNAAEALEIWQSFPRDYYMDFVYEGPKGLLLGLAYELDRRDAAAKIEWRAALQMVEKKIAAAPNNPASYLRQALLLACLGEKAAAGEALRTHEQLAGLSYTAEQPMTNAIARVYARLGRFDEIFAHPPGGDRSILRISPDFDALRADPRFASLMAAAGPAEPAKATIPRDWPKDPELKKAMNLTEGLEAIPDDLALAEEITKRVLDRSPTDVEAVTVMARVQSHYLRRGFDRSDERAAQAKRYAERALQLAPDEPEAMYALATYHFSRATGETARTEQLLRRAIELDPANPRPGRLLADLYNATNRPAEAITRGQDNIRRFPNDVLSHYDLARNYKDQSRYDEFDRELDATLALAPLPNAIVWKARLQFGLRNDFAGMKSWLDKVPPRVRGTERAVFGYFLYAAFGGDPEVGLAALRDFPQKWFTDFEYAGPTALLNASLLQLQGKRELALRQYEVAQGEIQRMRQTDPGRIGLSQVEFWTLLGLDRTEEAKVSYRRVVEGTRRPYAQDMVNGWWFTTIPAALLIGDRTTALTLLRESIETRPASRAAFRLRFQIDPRMAPFRDDPEIKALLADPGSVFAASAAKTEDKSVAVLAFTNLSSDKEQEYFSDGISEELLNVLAKVPGLKVTARTSAFHFKGKDTPIPEIARQLGVAYVVEGSVRKSGDKVRITAQLIKADGGFHVWSDTFTRDLKDVFAVQDEIAGLIAKNLELKMGMAAGPAREISPEAYQEYLVGRALVAKAGMADLKEAVRHFERAVAAEPKFTAAWVQLASAHTQLGRWGGAPTLQAWPAARTAIDHALSLEPDSPDVLLALGWIQRTADWNWRGAEQTYRRALALRPNHPDTLSAAAVLLFNIGQKEEALRLGRQAVQLDPLNPATQLDLSLIFYFSEEWAEQEKLARRAIQLAPAGVSYQVMLAYSLAGQRRFAEAEAAARLETDDVGRLSALGMFAVQQGQVEAARGYRRQLEELYLVRGDTADLQLGIADISAGLGEMDRAFAALEIIRTARDSSVAWLRNDYYLRPLYSDPRWPAFLRKVGLADDQLK